MQLQEQIVRAISTTLKNPIYQTMQLLNIKAILKSANFIKLMIQLRVKQVNILRAVEMLFGAIKRSIRGINVVSLNYSDGYSNFILDFAIRTTTQNLLGFRCES